LTKGKAMIDPIASVRKGHKLATVKAASPGVPSGQGGKTPALDLPSLVAISRDLARLGPPVDFDRVAKLQLAIEAKSYVLDARGIAASIIAFDQSSKRSA
jgi:hypothetical protein